MRRAGSGNLLGSGSLGLKQSTSTPQGTGLPPECRTKLSHGLFKIFREFEDGAALLLTELAGPQAVSAAVGHTSTGGAVVGASLGPAEAAMLAKTKPEVFGGSHGSHTSHVHSVGGVLNKSSNSFASGLSMRSSKSPKPDWVPPLNLAPLMKKDEAKSGGLKQAGGLKSGLARSSSNLSAGSMSQSSAAHSMSDGSDSHGGYSETGADANYGERYSMYTHPGGSIQGTMVSPVRAGATKGVELSFLVLDGIAEDSEFLSRGNSDPDQSTSCLTKVKRFARSPKFELVCAIMILINCAVLGIQADHSVGPSSSTGGRDAVNFGEHALVAVFLLEMMLRAWAGSWPLPPWSFDLRSFWSAMDLAVVLGSGVLCTWIIPECLGYDTNTLATARSLLVLRSLRLLQLQPPVLPSGCFRQAWIMLTALRYSFHVLALAFSAVAVTTYLFAVVGVSALGGPLDTWLQDDALEPGDVQELRALLTRVGSIGRMMETLLQTLTMDSFNDLSRRLSRFVDGAGFIFYAYLAVVWLVIGSMVATVLVENTARARRAVDEVVSREQEWIFAQALEALREVYEPPSMTPTSSGTVRSFRISMERLAKSLQDPEILGYWRALGIRSEDVVGLLRVLAVAPPDGGGGEAGATVSLTELFDGLEQLKAPRGAIDMLLLRRGLARMESRLEQRRAGGDAALGLGASAAALVVQKLAQDQASAVRGKSVTPGSSCKDVVILQHQLDHSGPPSLKACGAPSPTGTIGTNGTNHSQSLQSQAVSISAASVNDRASTPQLAEHEPEEDFPWEDMLKNAAELQAQEKVQRKVMIQTQRSSQAVGGDGGQDGPMEPPKSSKPKQYLSGHDENEI